jgi:hypothetical protein
MLKLEYYFVWKTGAAVRNEVCRRKLISICGRGNNTLVLVD